MQHPVLNVGVDVAKDTVVVACAAHSFPVQSVSNQRAPLRAWLKALPSSSLIGLESTGAYHELLADLAQAQGHTVFLLNPLDTRYYTKATGTRAKTDRVDAVIDRAAHRARASALAGLHAANQRKLDRLIRRRAKIVSLNGTLKLTMRRGALPPNSRPWWVNWMPCSPRLMPPWLRLRLVRPNTRKRSNGWKPLWASIRWWASA